MAGLASAMAVAPGCASIAGIDDLQVGQPSSSGDGAAGADSSLDSPLDHAGGAGGSEAGVPEAAAGGGAAGGASGGAGGSGGTAGSSGGGAGGVAGASGGAGGIAGAAGSTAAGGSAGTAGSACVPESKDSFCSHQDSVCGITDGPDNCGQARQEDCGVCACGHTCTKHQCVPGTCIVPGQTQKCGCDAECCSGLCSTATSLCCFGSGSSCGSGNQCGANAACCSGYCNNGQCWNGSPPCDGG